MNWFVEWAIVMPALPFSVAPIAGEESDCGVDPSICSDFAFPRYHAVSQLDLIGTDNSAIRLPELILSSLESMAEAKTTFSCRRYGRGKKANRR